MRTACSKHEEQCSRLALGLWNEEKTTYQRLGPDQQITAAFKWLPRVNNAAFLQLLFAVSPHRCLSKPTHTHFHLFDFVISV